MAKKILPIALLLCALSAVAMADAAELSFTDWATRGFNYFPNATVTEVKDYTYIGLVYIDCPVFDTASVDRFCTMAFEYVKIHYPNMNEFNTFWTPNTGKLFTYKTHHEREVKVITPDPAAPLYLTPEPTTTPELTAAPGTHYVLNTNTMKFHDPNCNSAKQIKEKNREDFVGDRQEVIDRGFVPCKLCNP